MNPLYPVADRKSDQIALIRVVAMCLVLVTHCNQWFSNDNLEMRTWSWYGAALTASASRISVPLFFILSGYLLIKTPNQDAVHFYCKRLRRLLVPIAFWSSFYILIRVYVHNQQISTPSSLRLIYNGDVYYHLWFLFSITGVYFAIPFLSSFVDYKNQRLLKLFIFFCFFFGSIIPCVDSQLTVMTGFRFHFGIPCDFFWGYLGYAALGALIREHEADMAPPLLCLLGFLVTVAATLLLTVNASFTAGSGSEQWFGYTQPLVAASSTFAFIGLLSIKFVSACDWLRSIAVHSFGVYLVHPIVIEWLSFPMRAISSSPIGAFPILFVVTLVISFALVSVIAKVPILRMTV